MAKVTSDHLRLIRESKHRTKYVDLSDDELEAYATVTASLKDLGTVVLNKLGSGHYELRLTSGYHVKSGVRGSIPKDLWFGLYAKENADPFVGSPQLFMIVSERGIEFGFAPSTHPSGFSNGEIKAAVRQAAPTIFDLLPAPHDETAEVLSSRLAASGDWHFRTKTRLTPNQSDFDSLAAWLTYLKSDKGKSDAGGAISRYVLDQDIDGTDLAQEMLEMAEIFRPLMETVRAAKEPTMQEAADDNPDATSDFATYLENLLVEFDSARDGPFGVVPSLWEVASNLREWLSACPPIRKRPYLTVGWSAGKGVWARVPWVSILNKNITTSTQDGVYCVFLISNDLKSVYLSLAQGVTQVIEDNGAKEGALILKDRAASFRSQAGELEASGFTLGNDLDLRCNGSLALNYERGTVAYMKFDIDKLPDDPSIVGALEALLSTYDKIAKGEAVEEVFEPQTGSELEIHLPFTFDDAMNGLFMAPEEFRRILAIWRLKKNLILQGAPGVGKSFAAKRLAYALLEERDPHRVETVQFHQSYGYEDFVQGYRPDGSGGFDLRDGIFYDFCSRARKDLERPYVFIIDEINRGNLSKIFGELMLLIETDKRSAEWAAKLSYAKKDEPPFFVPPNLHIIGMMNTADRSLSLVDYALRRRFGFVTLEPQFDSPKFADALADLGVDQATITHVAKRMGELNQTISDDTLNLGRGFRIGHSFFVPSVEVTDPRGWANLIVETEIRPLLEEYWLDDSDKVEQACTQLVLSAA